MDNTLVNAVIPHDVTYHTISPKSDIVISHKYLAADRDSDLSIFSENELGILKEAAAVTEAATIKEIELKINLKNEKYADTNAIINFIKNCKDNHLLTLFHKALLDKKADYLRACTGRIKMTFWQGTTHSGIAACSKSWAMIEKSFSLQVAQNEKAKYMKFTSEVASQRAIYLRDTYLFFADKTQHMVSM